MNRTSQDPPWTGLLAIVAGIALLTSACSGSPAQGGSGGAPAARGSASPSRGSDGSSVAGRPVTQQRQLAYSECMRSHGVPGVPTSFPKPVLGRPPSKGSLEPAQADGPGPGSPQWQAAQQACQSLMPSPAEVPG